MEVTVVSRVTPNEFNKHLSRLPSLPLFLPGSRSRKKEQSIAEEILRDTARHNFIKLPHLPFPPSPFFKPSSNDFSAVNDGE